MQNMPLDPHEIDALPNAGRIFATIEDARDDCDSEHQSAIDELLTKLNDAEGVIGDLYGELQWLVEAIEAGNQAKMKSQALSAKKCLERNV